MCKTVVSRFYDSFTIKVRAHKVGDNFSLSVKVDSVEEADKVFGALSEGGQVQMPMMDTFWGSYFGTLVDQFGIHWMVGYDHPQENQ